MPRLCRQCPFEFANLQQLFDLILGKRVDKTGEGISVDVAGFADSSTCSTRTTSGSTCIGIGDGIGGRGSCCHVGTVLHLLVGLLRSEISDLGIIHLHVPFVSTGFFRA